MGTYWLCLPSRFMVPPGTCDLGPRGTVEALPAFQMQSHYSGAGYEVDGRGGEQTSKGSEAAWWVAAAGALSPPHLGLGDQGKGNATRIQGIFCFLGRFCHWSHCWILEDRKRVKLRYLFSVPFQWLHTCLCLLWGPP